MPTPDPPGRYRPKYDPRRDDIDAEDGRGEYGLGPPDAPPPAPTVPDADDAAEPAPRRRKRKARPPGFGEVGPGHRDKLLGLDRPPDPEPLTQWWVPAAGCAAAGLLLGLVPIVAVLLKAQGGAKLIGYVVVGGVAAELAEVAALTAFLTAIGHAFGIEYGPVKEAVTKLAAVVLFVNGLTLALLAGCSPFAVALAVPAGVAAFWGLFKLSTTEAMITGLALTLASAGVNLIILSVIVSRL